MHVRMDYLRTRLAICLLGIALDVQAVVPQRLAIAAALQEQPIGQHALTTVTAQHKPLRAYFGHTTVHSEDDSLTRFNAKNTQIAACR